MFNLQEEKLGFLPALKAINECRIILSRFSVDNICQHSKLKFPLCIPTVFIVFSLFKVGDVGSKT